MVFLGLTAPAFLLASRVLVWWFFSFKVAPAAAWPLLNVKFWAVLLYESLLTLVFASTYQTVVLEFIKASVGGPRPIYHALNLWASVDVTSRGHFLSEAHRSFPSGHSATTSAGMGVVLLLLLRDAQLLRDTPWVSKLLAHASLAPFAVVVYVGVTRVRDYWHFAVDVAVGWAIGALSAVFCVAFLSGDSSRIYLLLLGDGAAFKNDLDSHILEFEPPLPSFPTKAPPPTTSASRRNA